MYCERAPMGEAPYKSAREGVGTLSSVSTFNHKRAPMPCLYSNLMPSKQIIGQTMTYCIAGNFRGVQVRGRAIFKDFMA